MRDRSQHTKFVLIFFSLPKKQPHRISIESESALVVYCALDVLSDKHSQFTDLKTVNANLDHFIVFFAPALSNC